MSESTQSSTETCDLDSNPISISTINSVEPCLQTDSNLPEENKQLKRDKENFEIDTQNVKCDREMSSPTKNCTNPINVLPCKEAEDCTEMVEGTQHSTPKASASENNLMPTENIQISSECESENSTELATEEMLLQCHTTNEMNPKDVVQSTTSNCGQHCTENLE